MPKPAPQTKESIQEELVQQQFAQAEAVAFDICENTTHVPPKVLIQALAIACGTVIGNEDWNEAGMPAFFELLKRQIEDRARAVRVAVDLFNQQEAQR